MIEKRVRSAILERKWEMKRLHEKEDDYSCNLSQFAKAKFYLAWFFAQSSRALSIDIDN